MAIQLAERDRFLIKKLRTEGILQDVESHRLDQRQGIILISCADGDQFPDVFSYHEATQTIHRPKPRIHPLTCHGGALAFVPHSPVNKRGIAHKVYLDQIPDARKLKGIDLLALYVHAPCAAATQARLNLEKVIAFQMKAKAQIKALNEGIQIACFLHVDHENGRKRTYFICRNDWDNWTEKNCIETFS